MAMEKLEGAELKKLIKLGKKKPMAFAYNPGKKTDQGFVMIDKRKPAKMLGKVAKTDGEGPKAAFGTFELKGKVLEMTCERVVPKMAKMLKMYLKTQKVTVNVLILDENGQELESEIEDLPPDPSMDDDEPGQQDLAQQDDDAQEAPEDVSEDDDSEEQQDDTERKAGLVARLKTAQPAVMAIEGPNGDTLKKVLAAAAGLIKAQDLDKAEETITKLEAALAKLGGSPAPEPEANVEPESRGPDARALAARAGELKQVIDGLEGPAKDKLLAALGTAAKAIKGGQLEAADGALTKIEAALNKVLASSQTEDSDTQEDEDEDTSNDLAAQWEREQARLQPLVDKAIEDKRGDLDAINRAFNYAKDLAADGAFERALASAKTTEELLNAAEEMTTTAAAQEAMDNIPADVVPYVQSRLAWIKTRGELRKEIENLKSAIDAQTKDIEGLEDVSSKSGVLFTYLDGIDSDLEDTLEKLVEAPEGPDRDNLKTQAQGIIRTYRGVLDEPFFQAVDDNGFVNTNIRGSALASLENVSSALAA